MLQKFRRRYEQYLLIDQNDRTGRLIRSRAIYSFGWAFILIQILNLVGMTSTYGGWTYDHGVAIVAILLVFAVIHCLRYYKNFAAYALLFSALSVGAPIASALPDGTGINSALIPFLIMTPMLNAFVCGPRMTIITGAIAICVVGFLYFWSSTQVVVDSTFYQPRNAQRALQAAFAVIMVSVIGSVFSANIFRAFELLEANVQRARQAEAAKTRFLATMSHELRTPLNGVLGLTEVLQNSELDDDQRSIAKTIDGSGRSLMNILNDILDLSKIEAGKLDITEQDFEPRTLVREIADTWRETAMSKGLLLSHNVGHSVPFALCGDDLRIRQIVSNFVSNAIKFTAEGAVTIDLQTIVADDHHQMIISVQDTGIGIGKMDHSKIFSAFEQADSTITRKYGGTGLGLSICNRLAMLMNGNIDVESSEGVGSKFTLTVPTTKAVAYSPPSAKGSISQSQFCSNCKLKVLVVEDNEINQMVAGRFLEALNIQFDLAVDGIAAVDAARSTKYDLILMDKHMPRMDGIEAMQNIRDLDDHYKEAPIIACTADAMTGEKEKLLEAGFNGFLSKPLSADMLSAAISKGLERRKILVA